MGGASAHCPQLTPAEAAAERVQLQGQKDGAKAPMPSSLDMSASAGFCKREPSSVICTGRQGVALSFFQIVQVDSAYRAEFEYRTDRTQYHVDDYWRSHTTCGDCEDAALSLSERLADAGEAGADMALLVSGVHGGGHATLQVFSSDRGWIEISNGRIGTPRPYDPAGLRYVDSHGKPALFEMRRLARVVMDGRRQIVELTPGGWWGPKTL